MELHKQYKVVYKDGDYSKILHATLIAQDIHLLTFENERDGMCVIGKSTIVSIKPVDGEADDKQ
jgi:hypothetical protein